MSVSWELQREMLRLFQSGSSEGPCTLPYLIINHFIHSIQFKNYCIFKRGCLQGKIAQPDKISLSQITQTNVKSCFPKGENCHFSLNVWLHIVGEPFICRIFPFLFTFLVFVSLVVHWSTRANVANTFKLTPCYSN